MPAHRLCTAFAKIGLLARFTLLSLAATILLGIALGDLSQQEISSRALRSAAQSAQLVASFGLQTQLSYTDMEKGLNLETIPALDYLFLSGYQAGTLARVEVINVHRRVVYSNNHALIGRPATPAAGLTGALQGRTTAAVVRGGAHGGGPELIESFVPLRFSDIGRPDGAFEVYTQYAPVAAAIAHDTHRLYEALAIGLVLFYAALFRIFQRASRQLRRQSQENHRQARLDALTQVPNRRAFFEHSAQALSRSGSSDPAAVMVVDLDRFKDVNDTFGHHHGDLLLQAAAQRICEAVRDRDHDVAARLGGDEFAVLLRSTSVQAAADVAARIGAALAEPFAVGDVTVGIEASIGIALFPEHGEDVDALLQHADLAMYCAKDRRDGYLIYSNGLESQPRERSASFTGAPVASSEIAPTAPC